MVACEEPGSRDPLVSAAAAPWRREQQGAHPDGLGLRPCSRGSRVTSLERQPADAGGRASRQVTHLALSDPSQVTHGSPLPEPGHRRAPVI